MQHTITSNFINILGKNLYYKSAGAGAAIILLHPSPLCSNTMLPFINLLAPHFKVFAIDLPGYGQSQSLQKPIATLANYLPTLHQFITAVTTNPIKIYGTATGAQLAIAYSLKYANKVSHTYLDNAAHFTPIQYTKILAHYFPNFEPTANGSHLQALWQHVERSCTHFPWYSNAEADRFSHQIPPPHIIQNIVNNYLLAGPNYADAYKCAFAHERAIHVQNLQTPTTIFNWLGSPIKKYIAQLLAHNFNNNIKIINTPVAIADRYLIMLDVMKGI